MYVHAPHSAAVERQMEAIAAIDEGLSCLRCGRLGQACGCFSHARRELVAANQAIEQRKAR